MAPRVVVVGVMGAGNRPDPADLAAAEVLGRAIAERGWATLCGGRDAGVMAHVSRAARSAGGLTIGILPDRKKESAGPDIILSIPTNLGNARNVLNILACDAVVVLANGLGSGTLSEAAMAVKERKPTILLTEKEKTRDFFREVLEYPDDAAPLEVVPGAEDAVRQLERWLPQSGFPTIAWHGRE